MYLCMYACMHACVYVCVCVYVCMYVCMYVCVYVCMHACMYVCMHACMYVCMMHACMHVWSYMCTPLSYFNITHINMYWYIWVLFHTPYIESPVLLLIRIISHEYSTRTKGTAKFGTVSLSTPWSVVYVAFGQIWPYTSKQVIQKVVFW